MIFIVIIAKELLIIMLLQHVICWENSCGHAEVAITYLLKAAVLQRGLVKMPVQVKYYTAFGVMQYQYLGTEFNILNKMLLCLSST